MPRPADASSHDGPVSPARDVSPKRHRRSSMEVFMDDLHITEDDMKAVGGKGGFQSILEEETTEDAGGAYAGPKGSLSNAEAHFEPKRVVSGSKDEKERGKALWGELSVQVNNRSNRNRTQRNPKKSELNAAKKRKAEFYARSVKEGKTRDETDQAWIDAADDESTEAVEDLLDLAALEKVPRRKRTPDDMVKIVLLGKEFNVHRLTLHESESKVLRRLKPTRRCVHYMPTLSEYNGQQTYYLCQRPDAFESVIMYIEGGALHPPQKMGLEEFIDELVFYEIKNIDSAISAFNKKEESESSTSEEEHRYEGDIFPGLKLQRHRARGADVHFKMPSTAMKLKKIVWRITDGGAADEWNKGEVAHEGADGGDGGATYLQASRIFDFVSFSMLFASVVIFCVETMPAYRTTQELRCTDSTGNTIPERQDCIFPHNTTDHAFSFTIPGQGVFTGTLYNYGNPGDCKCEYSTVHNPIPHQGFKISQIVFNAYFTLELLVRLLCCPAKVEFAKQLLNWVDLFAIVPYFVELGFPSEAASNPVHVFRVLRLFRIVRIARLSKRFAGLRIFAAAVYQSKFILFQLFLFIICLAAIFASMLFYTEYDVPEAECYGTCFSSVPQSLWWSIVTMTTLGYGDMVPRTALGKVIGGICSLCGILVLALPVPVFVENFQRLWDQHHLKERVRARRLKKREEEKKQALLGGGGRGFNAMAANVRKQLSEDRRHSRLDTQGDPSITGAADLVDPDEDSRMVAGPVLDSEKWNTGMLREKVGVLFGTNKKNKGNAGSDMTIKFPTGAKKPLKLQSTKDGKKSIALPIGASASTRKPSWRKDHQIHPDIESAPSQPRYTRGGHQLQADAEGAARPKRYSTHEFPTQAPL